MVAGPPSRCANLARGDPDHAGRRYSAVVLLLAPEA